MVTRSLILSAAAAALLTAGCASREADVTAAPGHTPHTPSGMVAAAHPLAAEAGVAMLEQGGNAIDAAVATAFALNVVEPFGSGMGGGGFLLYYDAETGETSVIDYRETAPSALTPDHYRIDGEPDSGTMNFGGMAVGAPGMVRGLLLAHRTHGTMPLETLLQPAIGHASDGFTITPNLARIIESKIDLMLEDEALGSIYLEDGLFARAAGTTLRQPELAGTLDRVVLEGEDAIYSADSSGNIADAVQNAGGILSAEDIQNFRPTPRAPISSSYRGYEIVTVGPPSSGGLTVLLALNILDRHDLTDMTFDSPEFLALLAKSLEAAQTATDATVADPAFVNVPVQELLSDAWTDNAAAEIRRDIGIRTAEVMQQGDFEVAYIPNDDAGPGNTTHFSIIDADGNMVALTQTINYWFGSGVAVPDTGIVLNNEMYDFSFEEGSVNLPAPGKKPRSSMAPMLVLKDGRPVAAIGTPGGRRIPAALAQILVRCIDFDTPLQDAISAPRLHVEAASKRLAYEPRFPEASIEGLARILGEDWQLQSRDEIDAYFGGAQGLWMEESETGAMVLNGAADPRRDGAVATTGR